MMKIDGCIVTTMILMSVIQEIAVEMDGLQTNGSACLVTGSMHVALQTVLVSNCSLNVQLILLLFKLSNYHLMLRKWSLISEKPLSTRFSEAVQWFNTNEMEPFTQCISELLQSQTTSMLTGCLRTPGKIHQRTT